MTNSKNDNQVGFLVCGSQKFDDKAFVFGTLETFYRETKGNLNSIFVSKYSGACEFARQWVEIKNQKLPDEQKISICDITINLNLERNNNNLYDNLEIPKEILADDPFFQKGSEAIASHNIKVVMAFPNPEGVLGASTRNIQRFAQLAGIPVFDCSELMSKIKDFREENSVQVVAEPAESIGLQNKHVNKLKK